MHGRCACETSVAYARKPSAARTSAVTVSRLIHATECRSRRARGHFGRPTTPNLRNAVSGRLPRSRRALRLAGRPVPWVLGLVVSLALTVVRRGVAGGRVEGAAPLSEVL